MLAAIAYFAVELSMCNSASAQGAWKPGPCRPISERTSEMGCWIVATEVLGQLPKAPVFWHLYAYATRTAAEAAKRPGESIVESLGKVWLLTIAEAGWQPPGGDRVAEIGPLPVSADQRYTAQYMEAVFPPGFDTTAHRHSGPEAWYTVAGEVCLETPGGKVIGRAGAKDGVIVPGGLPMRLSVTGTEQRRSLVLILHDSAQPHTILAADWTPKGLCKS
jgi:quercetin dioxygenase-like cupin family protein